MLQLEAPPEVLANLKPVTLGASSSLVVGQKVRRCALQPIKQLGVAAWRQAHKQAAVCRWWVRRGQQGG